MNLRRKVRQLRREPVKTVIALINAPETSFCEIIGVLLRIFRIFSIYHRAVSLTTRIVAVNDKLQTDASYFLQSIVTKLTSILPQTSFTLFLYIYLRSHN